MNCIFCKIAAGEIPGEILYQDEEVIAFRDIEPLAPIHLLIIPRRHIPSLTHLSDTDAPLIGHMVIIANQLARDEGIAGSGYRLVINCGEHGGQIVTHLHMHLLGGKRLSDSMG
ncbi:MAG TPA: histidine triad nucleotide-binding protein [Dehalococcoidales bacterium]|nr:histidine triad nucleotide-binding protein [Dehalococcoidales bacterium]